jgi:hypothetical protein
VQADHRADGRSLVALKPDCIVDQDYVHGLVGWTLDALLSALANALGNAIVKAATPAVEDALNDAVEELLPLPASCQTGSPGAARE